MTTKEERNRLRKIIDDRADAWINDQNTDTTQEETIVWHKYPDEKPPKDTWVLLSMTDGETDMHYTREDMGFWSDVNAWAYLPKGWQE